MRSGYRIRNFWAPAVLAMLVTGTGCASRGYVRTQVGENAETLSARIDDNREAVDRTLGDVTALETESRETNLEQDREIEQTQAMVAGAEAGIAEVRAVAESAGRQADSADDRTLTLARMFADRSRYVVEDSREIYFTFASSAIAPEHSEALQAVSDMLDSNPDAILVLEGRTDATGDPAFNEQLGQKRADATRNYLVMEMGVPIYKVHSFSFGEARPDYDNGVVEERQKNRSVKLLILGPDPQTAVASLPE